jgi:hypothetical protein
MSERVSGRRHGERSSSTALTRALRGSSREAIAAGALVGLLALTGCPPPPPKSAATLRAQDLPADPAKLAEMSAQLVEKGDTVSLENALVVNDRALSIEPGSYAPAWHAAQAAFRLADAAEHDKGRRAWFAGKGAAYAEGAIKANPKGVEGHFYRAVNLGYLASTKTLGALDLIPDIEHAAKAAVDADEKYDHCGPLRVLGMVLLKAPGWPTSVGDPDEAAERLGRAAQLCPDYEINHLYYGEALIAAGKACDAVKELERVLAAPAPGSDYTEQRTHQEAQEQLAKARAKCGK